MFLITGAGGKTGRALFECPPAFPLSHACIVTDKLQQIPPFDRLRTPLWVGEVQWRRGAKHATTRDSRIYLQPQTLEAHFLRFEIFKRYIEHNVVECRLVRA